MPFQKICGIIITLGGVAQLGERLNGIQEVKSSILSVSTNSRSYPFGYDLLFLFILGEDRKGRFCEAKCQPFSERLASPGACRRDSRAGRSSPSPPAARCRTQSENEIPANCKFHIPIGCSSKSHLAPPKQYQTNTYFFKGGFALKVLL